MSETTLQRILRDTGKSPVECKCQQCKNQCTVTPCLPTPEDVQALVDAGYKHRLADTIWAAGVIMGLTDRYILMVAPIYDRSKGACTFFTNGLCELHEKGLKPTEGRLSHHTTTAANFDPKRSLSWAVAKEWIDQPNEIEQFEARKVGVE